MKVPGARTNGRPASFASLFGRAAGTPVSWGPPRRPGSRAPSFPLRACPTPRAWSA